jgi:hypothetical protein
MFCVLGMWLWLRLVFRVERLRMRKWRRMLRLLIEEIAELR